MRVPTSTTDWCISALTRSSSRRLPLASISVAMCERKSRLTGSMVWYSSSMPMVKVGRIGDYRCMTMRPSRQAVCCHKLGRGVGRLLLQHFFLLRRSLLRSRLLLRRRYRLAQQRLCLQYRSRRRCLRLLEGQLGDRAHYPLEVFLPHRVQVGIGCGIHEVDGIRYPLFYCELHSVEVVTQRFAQRERVLLHPLQQLLVVGRRIEHIPLVVRPPRIVGHDVDLLLPDHIAAKVLLELHRTLQRHAQIAALVVCAEELFAIVDVINIAPSTAVHRLQKGGKADVFEDFIPVQRILE